MIRIKIQYDAKKRMFRLVDRSAAVLFEDGDQYDLELLLPFAEGEEFGECDLAATPIGHA